MEQETAISVAEIAGTRIVEGLSGEPLIRRTREVTRLLEACFSAGTRAALLYPANLTIAFFDLSSGEAGEILQTLRNYGVRLAIVCAPDDARFSSRFGEMVAEERHGPWFAVFETRDAAVDWLIRGNPDSIA